MQRLLVMYAGTVVESGATAEVFARLAHPYTRGLFSARPRIGLPRGTRLSLFPLGPVQGDSEGLRWPLAGLDFAPDGMIGTSNEVSGPVRLRMQAPKMLVILPIKSLRAALNGLGVGSAVRGE